MSAEGERITGSEAGGKAKRSRWKGKRVWFSGEKRERAREKVLCNEGRKIMEGNNLYVYFHSKAREYLLLL